MPSRTPEEQGSVEIPGDDLNQQILRISLSRLTRLAAELAKKENGQLPVQCGTEANSSALVPIRPISAGSLLLPLFLVHPIGGSVMSYYQLARYLRPELPIYGIERPFGLNPKLQLGRTIAEIATAYIGEIQSVTPEGPYLLGGYSMGGLIAFEMARQLIAQNHEVRFLALIDTPASVGRTLDSSVSDISITVGDLVMMATIIARGSEQRLDLPVEELERLAPDERLQYFLDVLKSRKVIPPHISAPLFRDLLAVVKSNEEAQQRYEPQPYSGSIDLFRASQVAEEFQRAAGGLYDDPTFGWQTFCNRPVMVNYVPGTHMRMMDHPHVQALGASLQRRLDRELSKRFINPH
jgi:thioesterase domain-containing protein